MADASAAKSTSDDIPVAPKKMSESRSYLADIIGEEGLQGIRLQAGSILDLIDSLAGRVAYKFCGQAVSTVCFDRVDLERPILHGDLVRLDGQVVSVGKTSMLVEVRVYVHDMALREYVPAQHSLVTMVAISAAHRPVPVARLEYDSDDGAILQEFVVKRNHLNLRLRESLAEVDKTPHLRVEDVEDKTVASKRQTELMTIAETEMEFRRQFYPRHLNINKTIFGGDVLLWMDRVATATARRFTRNPKMITISMSEIVFKTPIRVEDLVELIARVVYVRTHTVVVEVKVTIQQFATGESVQSHVGAFTVLNYDDVGFKRPITTGLRLDEADQEGLRSYERAKRRFYFWQANRAELLPPNYKSQWPHIPQHKLVATSTPAKA